MCVCRFERKASQIESETVSIETEAYLRLDFVCLCTAFLDDKEVFNRVVLFLLLLPFFLLAFFFFLGGLGLKCGLVCALGGVFLISQLIAFATLFLCAQLCFV